MGQNYLRPENDAHLCSYELVEVTGVSIRLLCVGFTTALFSLLYTLSISLSIRYHTYSIFTLSTSVLCHWLVISGNDLYNGGGRYIGVCGVYFILK